jgi:hypothetical protein
MADSPVAHLNIQNVTVVIVFPRETFDPKPEPEKHEISSPLQLCARGAAPSRPLPRA